MKSESTGQSLKSLLEAFIEQDDSAPRTSGQVVRDQRTKHGWTLDVLAEVTGIRATNLSSIENDKIAMTPHYADMFGAAFGIPAMFFLYPNGNPKKTKELEAIEKRALKMAIDGGHSPSKIAKGRTMSASKKPRSKSKAG